MFSSANLLNHGERNSPTQGAQSVLPEGEHSGTCLTHLQLPAGLLVLLPFLYNPLCSLHFCLPPVYLFFLLFEVFKVSSDVAHFYADWRTRKERLHLTSDKAKPHTKVINSMGTTKKGTVLPSDGSAISLPTIPVPFCLLQSGGWVSITNLIFEIFQYFEHHCIFHYHTLKKKIQFPLEMSLI